MTVISTITSISWFKSLASSSGLRVTTASMKIFEISLQPSSPKLSPGSPKEKNSKLALKSTSKEIP